MLGSVSKYKDRSLESDLQIIRPERVNYLLILMSHLENWVVFQMPNEFLEQGYKV